ncbi:hypothetical protein F0237_11750 [Vibrio tubiashii]|uniref:Uncharacterized protein n=1 Tax=Vibrio tubiashii TaxID=29498 RepID=A0AAE5GQW4_9VIBR|nr:hypothetical protein [Vibrio tubiashii]
MSQAISRQAKTFLRVLTKSWRKTGKLENWKTGKLENWKTGKLENWKTGKLENWKTKLLRCGREVNPSFPEGRSPFPLCSRFLSLFPQRVFLTTRDRIGRTCGFGLLGSLAADLFWIG